MINQEYENWKKEVENTLEIWKIELDKNPKTKELYNGFCIWYSNLIYNPKIMIIGINPNWSSMDKHETGIDMKEDSRLTFLHKYPKDKLGPQVIEIFKNAGLYSELEKETIKTNFFYLATKNAKQINECVNEVGGKFVGDFYMQSSKWTKQLVEIIKPTYILCEGKDAFNRVVETLQPKANIVWKNDCGYSKSPDSMIIIGYNRLFSNIKNKTALSNLLKELVK